MNTTGQQGWRSAGGRLAGEPVKPREQLRLSGLLRLKYRRQLPLCKLMTTAEHEPVTGSDPEQATTVAQLELETAAAQQEQETAATQELVNPGAQDSCNAGLVDFCSIGMGVGQTANGKPEAGVGRNTNGESGTGVSQTAAGELTVEVAQEQRHWST